jgi:hypothetical protein
MDRLHEEWQAELAAEVLAEILAVREEFEDA